MLPPYDQAGSEVPNTPFWLISAMRNVDMIIVGAGFTGLRVATKLKEENPHWGVTILEALEHGAAASSRNAGFACFGSPGELMSDINEMGINAAADLLSQRFQGIEALKSDMITHGLSISAEGGTEVFDIRDRASYDGIASRWDTLQELWERAGLPADLWESKRLDGLPGTLFHSGFRTNYEFGIDPQEVYASLERRAIEKGVVIRRGVNVGEIESSSIGIHVTTSAGTWKCDQLALCTNSGNTAFTWKDIYPGRGQIVVTQRLSDMPFEGNYHVDRGYYYFRSLGDRLLLGGGRHLFMENEKTRELKTSEEVLNHLKNYLDEILLPQTEVGIEYAWSGTMAFHEAGGKMPLIDSPERGVYRCVGFGGMGVALSNSAAMKLSSMILNDRS